MESLLTLWQSPIGHAAIVGVWAAFFVDLKEWMASTGWKVTGFHLGTATKRWATGLVSGALLGAGLS